MKENLSISNGALLMKKQTLQNSFLPPTRECNCTLDWTKFIGVWNFSLQLCLWVLLTRSDKYIRSRIRIEDHHPEWARFQLLIWPNFSQFWALCSRAKVISHIRGFVITEPPLKPCFETYWCIAPIPWPQIRRPPPPICPASFRTEFHRAYVWRPCTSCTRKFSSEKGRFGRDKKFKRPNLIWALMK